MRLNDTIKKIAAKKLFSSFTQVGSATHFGFYTLHEYEAAQ